MGRTAGLRRDGALGRLRRLHPRPGGLRRYGGLGSRMARSARLKLSGSPRSTWLYLARPSGDARLGCTRMRRDARLELTRSGAGLHLPGTRSDARLHLSGPAGHTGLDCAGMSRSHRAAPHRDDPGRRAASGRAGRSPRAAVVRAFPGLRGLPAAPPGRVSPDGSADWAATSESAPAAAGTTAWWPWTVTPLPGLRPLPAGPPAAGPWGSGLSAAAHFAGHG